MYFSWIIEKISVHFLKKDKRIKPDNYWAISFVPTLGKLFETVVYDQISL